MVVRGHSEFTATPWGAELGRHAERAHAHAVLRHRVGDMILEPLRLHVERRRQVEDVRIRAPSPGAGCRPASTRNVPRTLTPNMRSKRRAGVCERAGERDRAGVVDEHVDAAERLHGAAAPRPRRRRRRARRAAAPARGRRRPPPPRRRCGSFRRASDAAPRSCRSPRCWRRRARSAARSRARCRGDAPVMKIVLPFKPMIRSTAKTPRSKQKSRSDAGIVIRLYLLTALSVRALAVNCP